MPTRWTKIQALSAVTASPWTRDLRHVGAVFPRYWSQRQTYRDPSFKAVKPKDRITWWNIVPGDQVRVRGAAGDIREVFRINKLNNMVLLKKEVQANVGTSSAKDNTQAVHYSRCQLYVGKYQFPPAEGSTESQTLPVFAKRVHITTPKWYPELRRYDWQRFTTRTSPTLPGYTKESKEKILIPWPKKAKREYPAPSAYDTTLEAVAEITYQPPVLPHTTTSLVPAIPSEHEYIKALKTRSAFDLSAPVEVYMAKEVTNPHSRARKQQRWQQAQLREKTLLKEMIKEEARNLQGRTKKEATAEAFWKWRNRLIQERKAEVQRRHDVSGRTAKLVKKRERKVKKQQRLAKKLRALVLDAAPNQIIPGEKTTVRL